MRPKIFKGSGTKGLGKSNKTLAKVAKISGPKMAAIKQEIKAKTAPVSIKSLAKPKDQEDEMKIRKIKMPKVRLDKVAAGAVTGFAMGGPFGAAAGAGSGLLTGRKGGAWQGAATGAVAGGAVGAYTGKGLMGTKILPAAKGLLSNKAAGTGMNVTEYVAGTAKRTSVAGTDGAFAGALSAQSTEGSFTDKVAGFMSSAFGGNEAMPDGTMPSGMDMKKLFMFLGFAGLAVIIILKR